MQYPKILDVKKHIFTLLAICTFCSCKKQTTETKILSNKITQIIKPKYASGFEYQKHETYTLLTVTKPYPDAEKGLHYLLLKKGEKIPKSINYDALIRIPVEKIVVTSTTHIPALEDLDVLDKLIGFPNTKYISSEKARKLITAGKVKELGKNENINTEVLIDLEPDVVIGFGVDGSSKTFSNIQKSGIPVAYNGEWIEQHALGRAEWIKFFGLLFDKEQQANAVFEQVEIEYLSAKKLAEKATKNPTVLSGSMFKDTWYVPNGNSWGAKFIKDAHAQYLWKDAEGSGSIALNLESVLEKAQDAEFWVSAGSFQTKESLLASNKHYKQFDAFQNSMVYMSNKMGETGGLLFYEKAPSRPDLMLKDLIKIFHPELLPNYELYFYRKLN